MLIEFPDNLDSSNGVSPQPEVPIRFLHYCHKSPNFLKQDQNITTQIQNIENSYKIKVDQMVNQLLQEERDIINIIPKKANIDLKRSIQPKLDRLKKRTEKAIINLLTKKLNNSSNEEETHQNYPAQEDEQIEPIEQYDQEYDYYSD